MTAKTAEELSWMTPEERAAHWEAEARNVFGADYKRDKHGRPIEQGRGSKLQPTVNSMAALLAAEGLDSYRRAIEEATKAGVWPPLR